MATFAAARTAATTSVAVRQAVESTIDFHRDIAPIFERSCVGCHGDERPKARFSLTSFAALMKGGQSGEAAVMPGYADDSPLLHYILGEIEDLEMPPLNRRDKYPPVSDEEAARIRAWIDAGAAWPVAPPEPLLVTRTP
jgi:mono/diheme cytochrome c family protein